MKQFNKPAARVLLAGTAAVAMAAGSGAVLAPAGSVTGDLVYVCTTPIGPKDFKTVTDTDLPTTMQYGQSVAAVNLTSTVTIPADLAGLAYGFLGARTVDGNGVANVNIGATPAAVTSTIAKADIPATGDAPVVASGAAPAFKADTIGKTVVTAADYVANLTFYNEAGEPAITVEAACAPKTVNDNGTPDDTSDDTPFTQDLTVDTVNVVKATSTTNTKLSPSKAKRKVVARTVVKSKYGTPVTGKVRYVLKRNGVKVKTVTKTLSSAKASVTFTKLKPSGKYAVVSSYLGSATLKKDNDTDTFKW